MIGAVLVIGFYTFNRGAKLMRLAGFILLLLGETSLITVSSKLPRSIVKYSLIITMAVATIITIVFTYYVFADPCVFCTKNQFCDPNTGLCIDNTQYGSVSGVPVTPSSSPAALTEQEETDRLTDCTTICPNGQLCCGDNEFCTPVSVNNSDEIEIACCDQSRIFYRTIDGYATQAFCCPEGEIAADDKGNTDTGNKSRCVQSCGDGYCGVDESCIILKDIPRGTAADFTTAVNGIRDNLQKAGSTARIFSDPTTMTARICLKSNTCTFTKNVQSPPLQTGGYMFCYSGMPSMTTYDAGTKQTDLNPAFVQKDVFSDSLHTWACNPDKSSDSCDVNMRYTPFSPSNDSHLASGIDATYYTRSTISQDSNCSKDPDAFIVGCALHDIDRPGRKEVYPDIAAGACYQKFDCLDKDVPFWDQELHAQTQTCIAGEITFDCNTDGVVVPKDTIFYYTNSADIRAKTIQNLFGSSDNYEDFKKKGDDLDCSKDDLYKPTRGTLADTDSFPMTANTDEHDVTKFSFRSEVLARAAICAWLKDTIIWQKPSGVTCGLNCKPTDDKMGCGDGYAPYGMYAKTKVKSYFDKHYYRERCCTRNDPLFSPTRDGGLITTKGGGIWSGDIYGCSDPQECIRQVPDDKRNCSTTAMSDDCGTWVSNNHTGIWGNNILNKYQIFCRNSDGDISSRNCDQDC